MKLVFAMLMLIAPLVGIARDNQCFPYCYKCEFKVIDSSGKDILGTADFKPVTGEEELTHKIVNVRGTNLKAHATVFFTDESLASNAGFDSIRMALAFSEGDAEPAANSAIAEVTLNQFDTARVMSSTIWHGKRVVAFMECQSTENQKTNDGEKK